MSCESSLPSSEVNTDVLSVKGACVVDDFAIRVTNLSKIYQIYESPRDRLKQFVMPKIQRMTLQQRRQYFREFWALKDVTFEVKKGETIGIIGKNGSGKSTLLQIICGTLHPTSGVVETHGRIAALLELGSGFNPEFTGRENVYMSAAILGLTSSEIDEKYDAITAFANIGDFIEQPVKLYSSGMMLRLAFSVIAHVDADILVIDEALAVGDAFFTQKCMQFLRRFMEKGTVLFVSHDTPVVLNLCDKAILLDQGTVIAEGDSKDVVEQYICEVYASSQDVVCDNALDSVVEPTAELECRDMRQDLFNNSILRNDIQVFKFDPNKEPGFGAGGATITSVRILNADSSPLEWVVGGEEIMLEICSKVTKNLSHVIVGFLFKDRLGQVIFADNTYVFNMCSPLSVNSGENITVAFEFRMPLLPSGDYSVSAAIGTGTQEEHIQHHWIHNAMQLKVHASSICHGLVGVPIKNIEINVDRGDMK